MSFTCKLLISSVLAFSLSALLAPAHADVRVDIKNETSEDCSVAFNARVDKTKWITLGWFVFTAGEEAPVILKGANDIHDVFIYHDCVMQHKENAEIKKAWVKNNLKFSDNRPMENEEGYSEVEFERLQKTEYNISPQR